MKNINEIIDYLEKEVDKLPRLSDYDECYAAGARYIIFVLKMVAGAKTREETK